MSEYVEYVLGADDKAAQELLTKLKDKMEVSSLGDVIGEHGIGARAFYGVIVPTVKSLKDAGFSVELSIYEWTRTKTQIV